MCVSQFVLSTFAAPPSQLRPHSSALSAPPSLLHPHCAALIALPAQLRPLSSTLSAPPSQLRPVSPALFTLPSQLRSQIITWVQYPLKTTAGGLKLFAARDPFNLIRRYCIYSIFFKCNTANQILGTLLFLSTSLRAHLITSHFCLKYP